MHIFGQPIQHKGHDAPELPPQQPQTGLLLHLPAQTFLRAFKRLKFAAHPDPFVLIHILLLFDPVQHQPCTVLFQITEGGIDRLRGIVHRFFSFSYTKREQRPFDTAFVRGAVPFIAA